MATEIAFSILASLIASMERRDVGDLRTHDAGLHRLGERINWLTVEDPAR